MRVCVHCGYENADSASTCDQCYQLLAVSTDGQKAQVEPPTPSAAGPRSPTPPRPIPPPAPIPVPRAAALTRSQRVLRFVLGAVLGLIPAAIFAAGAFASQLYAGYFQPGWPFLGCLLFPVALIIMWVAFSRKTLRPLAYGLLAAALISPIVVSISCSLPQKV